jgi:hypothetical protein
MPTIDYKKAYEFQKAEQERLFKMEQAARWPEEKARRDAERRTERERKGLPPVAPPGEWLVQHSWPFRPLVTLGFRAVDAGRGLKAVAAVLGSLALFVVFANPANPVSVSANFKTTLTYLTGEAAPLAAAAVGAAAGWFLVPLSGLALALTMFLASRLLYGTVILLLLAVVYSTIAFFAGWPTPFK